MTSVKYIIGRADEDRYNITLLNEDIQMYGIYDGHSGEKIADYLRDNLPERLTVALLNIDFDDEQVMKKIITSVFIEFDTEIYQERLKLQLRGGSTANVVLRKGNKMYIANIADSRAIIFNSDGQVVLETVDHDGDNQNEINRINNLGGVVYDGRVNGTLMVTRAFGDFEYKISKDSYEYNPQGWVSAVPDIYSFDITQDNLTLLIASDGLWAGQYEDSLKVTKMILSLPKDNSSHFSVNDEVCNSIAKEGRENYPHYSIDDITIILVRL